METLGVTLRQTSDWVIDRIHTLCEKDLDDALALQSEFSEWLDNSNPEVDIYSLEYIGDI